MSDLYNRKRKLQRALQRLEDSLICEENKVKIKKFTKLLKAEVFTARRFQRYVENLTKVACCSTGNLETQLCNLFINMFV